MRRLLSAALLFVLLFPALARAEDPGANPSTTTGDAGPDTLTALNYLKQTRYEDAIASAKRALSRDERSVPAMLVMAKAYYWLKKYELASSIVGIAQQIDPSNAESYNLLGFVALSRQDIPSATANFKKATELKADYGNAWNNLAAQYLLAKNYDGALEAAQNAARLLPHFDKAQLNLGSAYRGKGQYVEAEGAYRKAIELNPNYAEVYFNLGILYLDAPQIPNTDVVNKLNTSIGFLSKYKNMASYRLSKEDPADAYIDEARKGIDREQKRLQRLQKQKERDAAKKPSPPPAAETPPAAAPPAAAPPASAPAAPAPSEAPPAAPAPGGL